MSSLYLIGGGARSGKSMFGERLALSFGPQPIYLASAQAYDQEMGLRILKHQEDRGSAFLTIESPLDILAALEGAPKGGAILWDCLTLWLSNQLMAELSDQAIHQELKTIMAGLLKVYTHVIVVTNEVGLGIVPEHALGRRFRDLAGRCHQDLALLADHVYFTVMGMTLRLKPGPVEVQP